MKLSFATTLLSIICIASRSHGMFWTIFQTAVSILPSLQLQARGKKTSPFVTVFRFSYSCSYLNARVRVTVSRSLMEPEQPPTYTPSSTSSSLPGTHKLVPLYQRRLQCRIVGIFHQRLPSLVVSSSHRALSSTHQSIRALLIPHSITRSRSTAVGVPFSRIDINPRAPTL